MELSGRAFRGVIRTSEAAALLPIPSEIVPNTRLLLLTGATGCEQATAAKSGTIQKQFFKVIVQTPLGSRTAQQMDLGLIQLEWKVQLSTCIPHGSRVLGFGTVLAGVSLIGFVC